MLRSSKNGYYEIRWEENGRTQFKSTRTKDRAQAEIALQRHVAEWHHPRVPADPRVSDLIASYERDHLPRIASPDSQQYALDKLKERLGAHRPIEITDATLKDYAKWRKAQKRWGRDDAGAIGDGTVAREVNALRGVLGWAKRNRLMTADVAIRLPVPIPPGRERCLSRDEVFRLLDACRPTPHIALFVRIALATAARKSAILELLWTQITWPTEPPNWRRGPGNEYDHQSLPPGMAIDMGRGVGNKRRAIVPIGDNAPLYNALLRAKDAAKTDHVIEFRGKPVADIKSALAHACRKAKVPDCTAHVLKHTSISWMVEKGIPFSVITKLTGTSTATLEKHYSHLSPGMASALGDLFSM
jgi:integrase